MALRIACESGWRRALAHLYGGPTPVYLASAEKTRTEVIVFDENVLTEKPDDISVFLLHMAHDAHYFALAELYFILQSDL